MRRTGVGRRFFRRATVTCRNREALQGLDNGLRVTYIGALSTILFPAMRLGYMVAPPTLMEMCVLAQRFHTTHPPILE
jgi:GntR family transcriptional regulator/MocR family aminotransferase